jgi:hypothetical protein
MINFLDKTGLGYFWGKIKEYIGIVASKTTVSVSNGVLTINSSNATDTRE